MGGNREVWESEGPEGDRGIGGGETEGPGGTEGQRSRRGQKNGKQTPESWVAVQ